MGIPRRPEPVKLFIGFIFRDDAVFAQARAVLIRKFGAPDSESPSFPFTHTHYYSAEFGGDLRRKFVAFSRLAHPRALAVVKCVTNEIERYFSKDGRRSINIDPGYLTLSKVVLATTKDYTHRIYLDKEIYAEVTLYYRDTSYRPHEWTYPDFRTPGHISFFNGLRVLYGRQI